MIWNRGFTAPETSAPARSNPCTESSSQPVAVGGDFNSQDNEHSNKRRRTALACRKCRTRKSRCDGDRPQCSACRELDFECIYEPPASSSSGGVGKEHMLAMEHRIKRLESRMTSMEGLSSGESTKIDGPTQLLVPGAQTAAEEELFQSHESTDGMGSIIHNKEESSAFFGPSSNIAFIQYVTRAIPKDPGVNQTWPTSEAQGQSLRVTPRETPSHEETRLSVGAQSTKIANSVVDMFAFPSDERMRELTQHYFSEPGRLFPFIHEHSFTKRYEEVKQGNGVRTSRNWLGLLNAILALATSTLVLPNLDAEERVNESDVYYQRAVQLCQTRIMHGLCSLEIVQYLLTLGQYLQGSQKSDQTWTMIGMAVRAAFQLGLHSPEVNSNYPPLESNIRQRTWFACIVLDRTLSMSFGRPSAIPDRYAALELPRPYPLSQNATQSSSDFQAQDTASIKFFNATIKLYRIMGSIIESCFDGNVGFGESNVVFDNASHVFKMEQELINWKRALPNELTLRSSYEVVSGEHEATTEEKLKIILTLRYLNLRILLHRTILVKFLRIIDQSTLEIDESELVLQQQIGSSSMQICAHASKEIISIAGSIVVANGPRRNLLGAWWFSLYYVFNAALVLFGLELVYQHPLWSQQLTTLPRDFLSSFDAAIEALKHLDKGNKLVATCRIFLQRLSNMLNKSLSSLQPDDFFNLNSMYTSEFGGNFAINTTVDEMNDIQPALGMHLGEFLLQDSI